MTAPEVAQIITSIATLGGVIVSAIVTLRTSQKVDSQVSTIKKLETNTNSIKDELVKVTALKSHAEGLLEGQAIEKANPT